MLVVTTSLQFELQRPITYLLPCWHKPASNDTQPTTPADNGTFMFAQPLTCLPHPHLAVVSMNLFPGALGQLALPHPGIHILKLTPAP